MSAYLQHLAQVSEIQPVLVVENILSAENKVIVGKGSPFTHETAVLLSKHSLANPIEQSIRLQDEFSAEIIYHLFNQFVLSDPVFEELYQLRDLDEKFVQCIEAFCQSPVLRQKLNVLAIQLPDVFDQSFFCGWVAVTILANENYPQFRLNNAFIAALSHDLGLLEVSPDILFKESPLEATEWAVMQQHPILSAKILKDIKDIDKECVKAVFDHHETVDGTGYPSGKIDKQLGDLSQLLHLLDSVNAIYRKHYRPRQRTLHDMVPIIQMSMLMKAGIFGDALIALFNQVSKTDHCTISEELVGAAVEMVQSNAEEIETFIRITAEFSKEVGVNHKDLQVLCLQNIARMIRATLSSCGIINEAYMRWLDQVRAEKLHFAYRELEDVLLMTQEIKFHMQRYERQIGQYLSQNSSTPLIDAVASLKSKVDGIKKAQPCEKGLLEYLRGCAS